MFVRSRRRFATTQRMIAPPISNKPTPPITKPIVAPLTGSSLPTSLPGSPESDPIGKLPLDDDGAPDTGARAVDGPNGTLTVTVVVVLVVLVIGAGVGDGVGCGVGDGVGGGVGCGVGFGVILTGSAALHAIARVGRRMSSFWTEFPMVD